MADEPTTTEGVQAPATPAAPAAIDHAPRLDAIEGSIKALADTLKATMARPAATPVSSDGKIVLPDHFKNLLRQQGVTDKEIELNGPIIVPWLTAMLATDGARIAGGVESVRGEVDMLKASRQAKKYPNWGEVEEAVIELRDSALKEGRFLSVQDAYAAAVANDIASPKSKIVEAKARIARKADEDGEGSNSDDLSAQTTQHQGTKPGAGGVRRTALTAEAIAAMSREERKKLFEGAMGDLPIRG